jgi:hypothetical protein
MIKGYEIAHGVRISGIYHKGPSIRTKRDKMGQKAYALKLIADFSKFTRSK